MVFKVQVSFACYGIFLKKLAYPQLGMLYYKQNYPSSLYKIQLGKSPFL